MSLYSVSGDIAMGHASYNNGDPIGFMLYSADKITDQELKEIISENVSIQIGVNSDEDPVTFQKAFYMTILLMDWNTDEGNILTKEQQREDLYNLLGQSENIYLETEDGVYSALEADDHVVTETQYQGFALASIRLEATNAVYIPAPPENFYNSLWQGPSLKPTTYIQQAVLQDDPTAEVQIGGDKIFKTFMPVSEQSAPPLSKNFIAILSDPIDDVEDLAIVIELKWIDELIMTNLDGFTIMKVLGTKDAIEVEPVKIELLYTTAVGWRIRILVLQDNDVYRNTAYETIDPAFINNTFVFKVFKATSDSSADGVAQILKNGIVEQEITGIQNFDSVYDEFRIGGMDGIDDGITGRLIYGQLRVGKEDGSDYSVDQTYQIPELAKWGEAQDNQGYWR